MKRMKRILALCIALTLMLSVFPTITVTSGAASYTKVESKLDFTGMPTYGEGKNDAATAENKEKVRQTLLEAGAVECENLFLKGNMETIVNPGGYRNAGYYIQKIAAAEGETIGDATLNFGYWITTNSTQGYIEVYVSADNVQYEKVYEQRQGNGAAFTNTRREETIDLPFAEDQTEIYVKFVMEHWDTYEGAGIAYSTLTVNASEHAPEEPNENTKVENTYSFEELPAGEVTAEDIGAIEESNLYYGLDGVALLSPRNGYEEASATWLIEAAEGETLNDCGLTIVGRTCYSVESVKNDHYLKVYASTDGVSYTLVKDFRANDNPDDNQEFPVDLTDVVKGSEKAYVKLEWMVFDSPHIFGIRSVTLTGNAASAEPEPPTEPETPTEPDTTVTKVESKLDFTGMPTYGEGKNDAATKSDRSHVVL